MRSPDEQVLTWAARVAGPSARIASATGMRAGGKPRLLSLAGAGRTCEVVLKTGDAAADLDLLSGDRFILGLGAGYSDQEIASLGAPGLSPVGKIDGLAEAVQVICGAWTHSSYSQDGRHHNVRPAGFRS